MRASPNVLANDFVAQWGEIRDDAVSAVDRVGRSGWLILGEELRSFERELACWWGIPHAVAVGSGLDALEIAMRCADIPPAARVLTTPLTAFATTLAILRAGLEPVWCDVDDTGGLDLEAADAVLAKDATIRAVLPVHLYGHPLDPDRLERLITKHGVVLIEDCAQSAGAERAGRPTGTVGIAAATSLYPTKNLGALGDGGVVLTADEGFAERARRMRHYGQAAPYEHVEMGLNSRFDELHAAILRSAMLPRLDGWLSRRAEIASRYRDALSETSLQPVLPAAGRSANHLFPVLSRNGDPQQTIEALISRGIAIGRHYPFVCPDQPATHHRGVSAGPLAKARALAQQELSLPMNPHLRDEQVEAVIRACLEVSG
jgi:dTDP-3-amino-3,4,6-trideoxy-alpha-D-glucose transaminase